MNIRYQPLLLTLLAFALCACSTARYTGSTTTGVHGSKNPVSLDKKAIHILLIPLDNATNSESASIAITEMCASSLSKQQITHTRAEGDERKANEDGKKPSWLTYARDQGSFTHLLRGSVHEYHYKTDLDGDPAVGISLRLIEASSGKTLWQGTSSVTGYTYASVSSAGQQAINILIDKMFGVSSR